jgi:hypothetical protein
MGRRDGFREQSTKDEKEKWAERTQSSRKSLLNNMKTTDKIKPDHRPEDVVGEEHAARG